VTIHMIDTTAEERGRLAVDLLTAQQTSDLLHDNGAGTHMAQLSRRGEFHYIDCSCGEWGSGGDRLLSSAFDAFFVEHAEPLVEALISPASANRLSLAPEACSGEGRPRESGGGMARDDAAERPSDDAGDDLEVPS
jgi:hypothetical protein